MAFPQQESDTHDAAVETKRSARDAWLRALQGTALIGQDPEATLPVVIERVAATFRDKAALIGDDQTLTYRELSDRIRRYASWARRQGIGPGDVICLMMRNCPEYMAVWLGITRMGGVVALINTSLVGEALAHAVTIAEPKHVIAEARFADAVDSALARLAAHPTVWVHGSGHERHASLDVRVDPSEAGQEYPSPKLSDRALCIYTSGTTGYPKAANVSHYRLLQWSRWFAGMMDAEPDDRMYNCLPMYHSIGGVVAPGAMLVAGGSVVVRERFSASRFWEEVAAHGCTVFQYIGELCRYLVNSPPHPLEAAHRLRLSCGNGLRLDVWERFRQRFGIPHNIEFYAATEANFSLYNCEGEPGSIGRIPAFLSHRFPVALVKFDVETGEPMRGEDGLCVRCATGEAGEAISRISDDTGKTGTPFEGYTDRRDSAKKILRNVFADGDAWFRSGDLMRKDARGFYYFVDRIGDTFRWKGENVSTTEVAEAISACSGVLEAVVYGVAVADTDGRAGMASIVVGPGFEFGDLRRHLAAHLPEHARPLFWRVCDAIAATGTFKQAKQDLVREGFDPRRTADAIYLDDRAGGRLVRIDADLFEAIESGRVRL